MQIIGAFVAGIVVGAGVFWLITNRDLGNVKNTRADNEIKLSEQIIVGDNGVVVEDQTPGKSVAVAQAVLKVPAWVAIHDDVNGKPGNILGAQLFAEGKTSGKVELLRATEAGKSYIAVIHIDKGDWRLFNVALNVPLLGEDGSMITSSFNAAN